MTDAGTGLTFPDSYDHAAWIVVYSEACLSHKNPGTADIYQRILRDFFLWLAESLGSSSSFFPQLTRSTVEIYMTGSHATAALAHLEQETFGSVSPTGCATSL